MGPYRSISAVLQVMADEQKQYVCAEALDGRLPAAVQKDVMSHRKPLHQMKWGLRLWYKPSLRILQLHSFRALQRPASCSKSYKTYQNGRPKTNAKPIKDLFQSFCFLFFVFFLLFRFTVFGLASPNQWPAECWHASLLCVASCRIMQQLRMKALVGMQGRPGGTSCMSSRLRVTSLGPPTVSWAQTSPRRAVMAI